MDERYVTESVHKEFAEKIEAENNRQNHRIENLENEIKQISELVTSVKVLAVNIDARNSVVVLNFNYFPLVCYLIKILNIRQNFCHQICFDVK